MSEISVGKVIIQPAYHSHYSSHVQEEQSVEVLLTMDGIVLRVKGNSNDVEPGERKTKGDASGGKRMKLDLTQSLDLGQLILKATEVCSEYSTERKRLDEELQGLEAKYQARINGIDDEVDVTTTESTFVITKALG